jgi:YegS/Rv2252/BmrU family lipid kinase
VKRLFIVNPKAGNKKDIASLKGAILKYFPKAQITLTEHKGHASELAAKAAAEHCGQVIVAGGDGTINEVVQSLAGSNTALGVIATGSGNGLARELGCPLNNFAAAAKALLDFNEVRCDLGKIGGEYFVNLAGIGIEANIAHKFDQKGLRGARGKLPYFKIAVEEFFKYKAPQAQVILDNGEVKNLNPLTLVFSNGRQYGSNFKIAPKASFSDGYLDMVEIPKSDFGRLLLGLPNFFIDGISPIKISKTTKIKSAEVKIKGPFYYHLDGEPRRAENNLKIEIIEDAITLLMK